MCALFCRLCAEGHDSATKEIDWEIDAGPQGPAQHLCEQPLLFELQYSSLCEQVDLPAGKQLLLC